MNRAKLIELRKEKGETQRDVAIATGITEATISEIERGSRENPTIKNVKKIAEHFGVTVDELLSEK